MPRVAGGRGMPAGREAGGRRLRPPCVSFWVVDGLHRHFRIGASEDAGRFDVCHWRPEPIFRAETTPEDKAHCCLSAHPPWPATPPPPSEGQGLQTINLQRQLTNMRRGGRARPVALVLAVCGVWLISIAHAKQFQFSSLLCPVTSDQE